MNPLNYVSDEEFLPFLQSLEVESDRKSFEWMFNDPELSGILRWLYNSLDQSNALSAREKYRYAEIEQQLLSPEDLDVYIESLQDEFKGICLPGDQEAQQDIKTDIQMQNERLKHLEKQEAIIKDMIKQNDLTKEELSREITKLNSAQHQLSQDEATSAEDCLTLAAEVETLTEGVVDEIAKKFMAFGPFESYRQTQALYRSHFDMFVSRRFNSKRHEVSDGDLKSALVEANVIGESHLSMAEQAALDLEQEEPYLEQQVQGAVRGLVDARTRLAAETTARAALAVRE
ncbi:hypothetical protein MSG28_008912 [Choristoneura fumiferana]|uniref:Uncharacterized protein n=1 Tax=Choristoneura fumiferana TaxID=7141 RepID=A0ACC0J8L0_CHOFU|nr:hypothetical protein MSG28_008912 [Choristoneura fumiferana]